MTSDVSTNYMMLSKNTSDLSNNISSITNQNKTGLYDVMMANPIYDFSGNSFLYNEKNPSLVDERINDDKRMIEDNGNVFFLGGLTMATLVVFGLLLNSS
jgi:type I restriction-modification system DNA methylase subunit